MLMDGVLSDMAGYGSLAGLAVEVVKLHQHTRVGHFRRVLLGLLGALRYERQLAGVATGMVRSDAFEQLQRKYSKVRGRFGPDLVQVEDTKGSAEEEE